MRVSVCIASYNGETYIKEQLVSILKQLSSDDEIIISDDGSDDDTLNIINNFSDDRIKLYHHKSEIIPNSIQNKFRRATLNFENAIHFALGDYIFLADQDDIWCANKIQTCLPLLQKFDLVVHDTFFIDGIGNQFSHELNLPFRSGVYNLIQNSYVGCLMAFNKRVKNLAVPFPNGLIAHDIWIGFIANYYGRVFFLHQKLLYNRRHGNNVSFNAEKNGNNTIFRIYFRFQVLKETLKYIMSSIFRKITGK